MPAQLGRDGGGASGSPASGKPDAQDGAEAPDAQWSWLAEARDQARLAAPICLALICNRYMATVSTVLVGHQGATELAGVGLAVSLANVSGNSVMVGISGSLQTLAGRAFGAGNFEEVSLSLQRCVMICGLVLLPIAAMWLRAESLLLLLGQEPEVAALASSYLARLLPGLCCFTVTQCLQNWLAAQRVTRPGGAGGMIMAVLYLPLCWLLVYPLGLGFLGAAWATSVANLFLMSWLAFQARRYARTELQSSWQGLSRKAFRGWCPYLRLALPAFVMISEWWASEISVLLAGRLPEAEDSLAALSMMTTTVAFCFMPPLSVSIAATTRVSNELGAGRPWAAKRAAGVSCGLGGCVVSFCAAALLVGRWPWAHLFTSDEEVLSKALPVLAVSAAYVLFDGMCAVTSGALKGCGRQPVLAPVVVASYYLVGLPACGLLAFHFNVGTMGLAWGMTLGTAVHCLSFVVLLVTNRWVAMAQIAQASVGARAALLPTEDASADQGEDGPERGGLDA